MGTSDETVALNLFQDPDTSGFLVNWPYVWAAFPANGVEFIDDIGWAMYPATSDEGDPAPPPERRRRQDPKQHQRRQRQKTGQNRYARSSHGREDGQA